MTTPTYRAFFAGVVKAQVAARRVLIGPESSDVTRREGSK